MCGCNGILSLFRPSVYDKLIPRALKQRYERLKSSVNESETNFGAQLSSIDKLRILLRDMEEDEETRQNREALDRRKVYLRDRCLKKLFVQQFDADDGKAGELSQFVVSFFEFGFACLGYAIILLHDP